LRSEHIKPRKDNIQMDLIIIKRSIEEKIMHAPIENRIEVIEKQANETNVAFAP
jgi:hypothetical protein